MPSNMEQDLFDSLPPEDMDLLEREERCQKALKAVAKAILMRLVICGLLIWILLRTAMDLWVTGLVVLVALMNVSGILPLAAEWKKRRLEWKQLLEEE